MKLKIKKELLLDGLNKVSKALSSKNLVPVLQGIKFELSNKGLLKYCRVIQMCGFGSLAEYYKKSCTMNYAALP